MSQLPYKALTRVSIGPQTQSQAAVVAGLSENDLVVLYPDRSLRDGQRVLARAD